MIARALIVLGTLATVLALSSSGQAATPRASLTDIENDVMCLTCHEPLAVADSPQADQERAVISRLIAQGLTKSQIENALVAQYGVAVLGLPPAHGFNLTVYILPPALVAVGLLVLALTLPKWRRRARAAAAAVPALGPALSPSDSRRLDDELERFG